MSTYRQLFDILVAVLLSATVTALTAPVAPAFAQSAGVLVACVFYFSRHPWGSQNGERINDWIDGLYDRHLPF